MKNQLNDNSNEFFQLKDDFSHDLNSLFVSSDPVSPDLDEKILHQARRHFAASGHKHKFARWLRWPAAAAAAVILGAIGLNNFNAPLQNAQTPVVIAREDIDRNGRVDILDVLALAQSIKSSANINPAWDFNQDQQINQADIDRVAFAAVSLKPEVL